MSIAENYKHLRLEIPDNVAIVLAAKHRTTQEVAEAIEAGADNIGENYVQEAGLMFSDLKKEATKVKWHMIGHLQTNKISKALRIFDVIQTVDSLEQAEAINDRVIKAKKQIMPVFIEINIGSEYSKAGIRPNEHEPFENYMENFIRDISRLGYVQIEGVMTMGPRFGNPENLRPYFRRTRIIFDRIKCLNLPNVNMKYLSMGMTNSYKVAIEEGSNMVRIGTAVFGERPSCKTEQAQSISAISKSIRGKLS
ncbi:MAG: YggS family pyridoxal phosphate-dependent enzyme [Sedimentisphaerales bacterium]|nr:YggS family pyridoxal phosphate-dependent enzyme [Sedimentisphaerales bacterium]